MMSRFKSNPVLSRAMEQSPEIYNLFFPKGTRLRAGCEKGREIKRCFLCFTKTKPVWRFNRRFCLPSVVYKKQYACQRPKSALATSLMGISPPAFLANAAFLSLAGSQKFLGADLAAGKAFEAAGLPPGNESYVVSLRRCPKKPCCSLYTEGSIS